MRRVLGRLRLAARVLALANRLSRLGPDRRSRLRIAQATFLLGARRVLRRPGRRWHSLSVRIGTTRAVVAVSDYGELEVMRDILLDEEYSLGAVPAPRVILDVGANIGLAALYFRAQYPDAEIVAIEPDPQTFAKLERNLGDDPRIRPVNVAVAAEPGELQLFRPTGYSIASSLKRDEPDQGEYARVRAETLDGLCTELSLDRIDLVKLDVEGAELEAFRGFSRLEEVPVVIGEAHPGLLGDDLDEFFGHLETFEVRRLSESEDAISFLALGREALLREVGAN